jgi:hypothetical protein
MSRASALKGSPPVFGQPAECRGTREAGRPPQDRLVQPIAPIWQFCVRPASSHASCSSKRNARPFIGSEGSRRSLLENHACQFDPRQAARRSRSGRGRAAARVLARIGHCCAEEFVGAWRCPSRSRFLSGRRSERRLLCPKPSERRAILRRPQSEWRCSRESVHQE